MCLGQAGLLSVEGLQVLKKLRSESESTCNLQPGSCQSWVNRNHPWTEVDFEVACDVATQREGNFVSHCPKRRQQPVHRKQAERLWFGARLASVSGVSRSSGRSISSLGHFWKLADDEVGGRWQEHEVAIFVSLGPVCLPVCLCVCLYVF